MDNSRDATALPFSQAAANNTGPIISVLQQYLGPARFAGGLLVEVGSGTGQHAVAMASALPHLSWLPTDLPHHLDDIARRCQLEGPENILPPIALDAAAPWPPLPTPDVVFTANTLHIMAWPDVVSAIGHVAEALKPDGLFIVYGPFNYGGTFTTPSNEAFDRWLKSQSPAQGLRDAEAVCALAETHGLRLLQDHAMPANNRTLVFTRTAAG